MSRLERPLLAKTIALTGDIALRAELALRIKTNSQSWEPVNFLVDPGTEMTTLPAARAKQLGIPFPQKPVPRLGITGKNAEVRAGLIRARVDGMDPHDYVFPCYFIGDPDAPFDPNRPPRFPRSLLGLSGVVDKIRILFDGTPTATAPHGLMVIEKI
jgi:Aspartyl protease